MTRLRIGLGVLLIPFIAVGCRDGDGGEPASTSSHALNATPAITNCMPDQEAQLRQAVQLAVQWLNDSRMQSCVDDAFGNGPSSGRTPPRRGSGYPEYIIASMRDNMATNLVCDEFFLPTHAKAVAVPDTNPEKTFVRKSEVLNLTPSAWARLLLHETAHQKYFDHFNSPGGGASELPLSPNQVLEDCALGIEANVPSPVAQLSRKRLVGTERPLPPVGQELGSTFNLACLQSDTDTPTIADGLVGTVDANGVRQLALTCRSKDRTDTLHYYSNVVGLGAGTAFQRICRDDEVLVGLRGKSQDYVNSIVGLCYHHGFVDQKIPVSSPRELLPLGNDTGSVSWTRMCPTGMAIKAVRVHHSTTARRLEILCHDYNKAEKCDVREHAFKAGGSGGESVEIECPGRGLARGVEGHFPKPGMNLPVARMGINCSETVPPASFVTVNQNNGFFPTASVGAGIASSGLESRSETCPDVPIAQAMVGLTVHHDGSFVTGIQTLCGNVRDWPRAGTLMSTLPLQGSSSTTSQTLLCPVGRYLTGVRAEVFGQGVRSLRPLCRAFGSPRGAPHDFNGDGLPDLIVRQASNGNLFMIPGLGNGALNPGRSLLPIADWRGFGHLFSIGDFYGNGRAEGDGKADIVGRGSNNVLSLYEGNGRGSWKTGNPIPLGSFSAYDLFVGARDWNSDGNVDLLARKPDGTLWFWKSSGDNTNWNPTIATQIGDSGWAGASITAVGDFTSDGTQDLMVRWPFDGGRIYLREGNGAGDFKPASSMAIASGWDIYDMVLGAGDFSGDGRADVITRKPDGTLWLFQGNGAGGFKSTTPSQIGTGFQQYDVIMPIW